MSDFSINGKALAGFVDSLAGEVTGQQRTIVRWADEEYGIQDAPRSPDDVVEHVVFRWPEPMGDGELVVKAVRGVSLADL